MPDSGVAVPPDPDRCAQWQSEYLWVEVEEAWMSKWIKTILTVLVVGFCLYYLFSRPEAAASAVKTFFGAFDSIGRFFVELSR